MIGFAVLAVTRRELLDCDCFEWVLLCIAG